MNIGNALLFRLPADLKLRQWQLDMALSVFFVTYVVFETPHGRCRSWRFPGCKPSPPLHRPTFSFFFSSRHRRRRRQQSSNPCRLLLDRYVLQTVGSAKTILLLLQRRQPSWRLWRSAGQRHILTCLFSAVAFFLVSDFPEDAKWLSANERAFVVSRLKGDQGSSGLGAPITWQGVIKTFSDWKMIPGALMYFGPAVPAYDDFGGICPFLADR